MGMNTRVLESILEAVNVNGDELLDELMDIEAAMPAAVDLAPVGQAIGEGLGSVVQVLEDIRDAMPVAPVPAEDTFRNAMTELVGQQVTMAILQMNEELKMQLKHVGQDYVVVGSDYASIYVPFSAVTRVQH